MEYGKNRNNDRRNNGKGRDFKKSAPHRDNERQRFTEELDETVVIGRNAVKELLSGGRDVDKLYITSGEREGSINQLLGIASDRGIPITECDRSRLDAMAKGGRHQGIIAIAAERNYSSIDEILAYAEEKGEAPFVVVCDGIEACRMALLKLNKRGVRRCSRYHYPPETRGWTYCYRC